MVRAKDKGEVYDEFIEGVSTGTRRSAAGGTELAGQVKRVVLMSFLTTRCYS